MVTQRVAAHSAFGTLTAVRDVQSFRVGDRAGAGAVLDRAIASLFPHPPSEQLTALALSSFDTNKRVTAITLDGDKRHTE